MTNMAGTQPEKNLLKASRRKEQHLYLSCAAVPAVHPKTVRQRQNTANPDYS
jgi:hypothetical protein